MLEVVGLFVIDNLLIICYNVGAVKLHNVFPIVGKYFGKKCFLYFINPTIGNEVNCKQGDTFSVCLSEAHLFLFTISKKKERNTMNEFENLFFAILKEVGNIADEFDGNPVYEPIVQRLREIDLIAEEMYVSRSWGEDEISEDDE